MIKHLVQHGNSLALIIDKPILKMLGVTQETSLKISMHGKVITITPQEVAKAPKKKKEAVSKVKKTATTREKKIKSIYQNVASRYKKDLEKLAAT